ncbi:hypothetical protein [Campylobacter hyointestinalis]|uniref:hypothetical protein n=1 Tax=Campylobacter hyointestinalis TaxID=198 RepID=UPI000DCB1793|nr:hypothetical protein [Campylobacter hyointestinalis]RAZ26618.1 hypothetical protein CHL9752_00485 [Campylobacter hyointestinalis subsp. lawsonii]RAZ40496.1 hypothetical protein CHL9426_00660 [Campylobacter hyointestinalis subsp. lawsonii]
MNDDKFKRVRYLRALEKYSKLVIRNLKREDFDMDKFTALIKKNLEILLKVEPAFLDQPYTKSLCDFVNLTSRSTDKEELLRAANNLEKLKNSKTYKKEKHKKGGLDEY